MKLYDIIDCLSMVGDKEQDFDIDCIIEVLGLYDRAKGCGQKAQELIEDGKTSRDFIQGWFDEMHKTESEIRRYKTK